MVYQWTRLTAWCPWAVGNCLAWCRLCLLLGRRSQHLCHYWTLAGHRTRGEVIDIGMPQSLHLHVPPCSGAWQQYCQNAAAICGARASHSSAVQSSQISRHCQPGQLLRPVTRGDQQPSTDSRQSLLLEIVPGNLLRQMSREIDCQEFSSRSLEGWACAWSLRV